MKLEVGKYYKTRDGSLILVNDLNKLTGWFRGLLLDGRVKLCNFHFLSDGTNIGEGDGFRWVDLIAEWTDTPAVGTLAEIGAQVGDVVEYEMGFRKFKTTVTELTMIHDWACHRAWRIVSRASDYQPSDDECVEAAMAKGIDYPAQPKGPVITETVKRIVPGVYGSLRIDDCASPNYISIELADDVFTKEEIRAIIATLTQVVDAMPEDW